MRIAVLTHAEAADSAVFANLAKHLLGEPGVIAHLDRPDVGVDVPLALTSLPTPAATVFAAPPVPAPVPVPAPTLPSADTAPTGAPAVDKAGLPWDGRIHSSSKVFVADGTWRQKRGTPPELLAQVEAELRQVMGLPAPAAPAAAVPQPPVPPTVPTSVFGAGAVAAGLPQPSLVPQPPAAPTAPAAPAAGGDPTTFAELMLWLTPHMPHRLPPDTLNAMLAANGVPSLHGLIARPDLVPVMVAQLKPLLA